MKHAGSVVGGISGFSSSYINSRLDNKKGGKVGVVSLVHGARQAALGGMNTFLDKCIPVREEFETVILSSIMGGVEDVFDFTSGLVWDLISQENERH